MDAAPRRTPAPMETKLRSTIAAARNFNSGPLKGLAMPGNRISPMEFAGGTISGVVTEAVKALNAEEITDLCLRHTLYDWAAQAGLKPLPVVGAQGVYFHTADGRRFIDFNSQLMCVNAGHGDRRIIEAIQRQAEQLPYISPFMAHESRARLGRKLAEVRSEERRGGEEGRSRWWPYH